MEGKKVCESATLMTHVPMPDEANVAGNMHGGFLLKHIDTAGGVAAMRHSRGRAVTASLERMDFLTPVHLGEVITFKASVNRVGRTSMDVGVRVEVEQISSGEVRHAASCYLTLVAVTKDGAPREVPPLILETEDDVRRHAKAEERRRLRQMGAGKG